jgi:serine/threonine protein kinase
MSTSAAQSSSRDRIAADPALAELVDRLTARLQAGEPVDLDAIAANHPEYAGRIRQLLPALEVLADLGRSTAHQAAPSELEPLAELGVLGDYRIVREVGRGGMGVVYEARQLSLNRRVALKVLPFAAALDPRQLQRFQVEAQAAACLHHPHIVPVHGVGCERGVHYYAMQLIEGQSLAAMISELRRRDGLDQGDGPDPVLSAISTTNLAARLLSGGVSGRPVGAGSDSSTVTVPASVSPPQVPTPATRPGGRTRSSGSSTRNRDYIRAAARLALQAAEALDHAHARGILHRDIKPANLLLDAEARLWVTDFGLAHVRGDDRLTLSGDVPGTLRYMSPEQALGRRVVIDGRTDIYSLGVTLYELLTLRPAVDGRDRAEVLRRIAEEEPTPLRRHNPAVPADLETIVLKATDKDPSGRYASAGELAEDLRRFLEDCPIRARRPSPLDRAAKWSRRHQSVMTTAALLLVLGLALSTWQAWRATRAENLARQRLGEVEGARAATAAALQQTEEARAQADAVSTFLVEAFRSPDPSQDGRQVQVADVLDRASAKLDKDFAGSPATKGALLAALGTTYQGLGLYDKAVSSHTKAAALREATLGPDHPDTLTSRHNLANAYRDAGRTSEAIALIQATLKLRESTLGPDHPDTLKSRNSLAIAYMNAGRTSEAIALHQATLKLREAVLGPDHPDTLTSRINLAAAYRDAGRTSEAIGLHQAALKLREAKLGPEHPDTLGSRNNLAIAYLDVGRTAEAIALHQATLKLMESKLGPDHPLTLTSRNNLANAYLNAGRFPEAIALHQATLKLRESTLGPDHPDTLTSRHNLADAYRDAGRTSEAIALIQATLNLRESKLGPDHPDTLTSRINLANAYKAAGRAAEAIALYEATLKLQESKLGPDHPLTLTSRNNLANAYLNAGRFPEAIALHQATLKLRESTLGPDHPDTLTSRHNLALAYQGVGRLAEAIALYEATLRMSESKLGPEHPDTLNCRNSLALAYGDAGRLSEAIALHEGTLKLREDKLGSDHSDTLKSRNSLALAYQAAGRTTEAIALHQATLKLMESKLGPDHPDTLGSRINLANAYNHPGRISEAIALLEATLKLCEVKLGPDQSLTLVCRKNLAVAYGAAGRISEAIAVLEATLKLCKAKLGPEHPETLNMMVTLGFARAASAQAEKAKQLYEQALAVQLRDRPDHPDTLRTMMELVRVYAALGQYDRATQMGRRSVEGNLRVRVLAHPETLRSIQNYVAAAQRSDRTNHEAARKLLETLRDRSRRELGHDAKTTITLTDWLADTLVLLGRTDQAIAVLDDLPENRRSLDVRTELARSLYSHSDRKAALVLFQRVEALRPRLVPADDPFSLWSRTRLALVLREHGRFAEARPLLEQTVAEALRLRKKLPKRDRAIEQPRGIAQFLLSRWPGLAPGISPAARPPASFAIDALFRAKSPVADGRLDPEEYGSALEVTFEGDANPGRLWSGGQSRSKTPDDLSARIYTAYTERSLFLAFQVRDQFVDASELDAKSPHNHDGVQVCINGDQVANDLTPVSLTGRSGNREGFALGADAAGNRGAAPGDLTDAGWRAGTSRTSDGYIIEFEIPLALIDTRDGPEFVPATSGSELRVNFGITDNDAPVHEQTNLGIFWAEDSDVTPWFGGEDFWTVSLRLVPRPASRP